MSMGSFESPDLLERSVLERGIDLYVDIRNSAYDPLVYCKLSLNIESMDALLRLQKLCVASHPHHETGRWEFATFDAETEVVLNSATTATVSATDFGVTGELFGGLGGVECHRIEFEALRVAIASGRHDHVARSGYAAVGGALLYTGFEFGLDAFQAFVVNDVPELAAAEIALDMAERIASQLPVAERSGATHARRRVVV